MDGHRNRGRQHRCVERGTCGVVVFAGQHDHGRDCRDSARNHRRSHSGSSEGEAVSAHLDDMWPMIEDAVFRLFDELMATSDAGEHIAIGPRLEEMGWAAIESEYPIDACELLFRAQGRS